MTDSTFEHPKCPARKYVRTTELQPSYFSDDDTNHKTSSIANSTYALGLAMGFVVSYFMLLIR
jgi:hypothetical protein